MRFSAGTPFDDVTRKPNFEGGYNAVLLKYGEYLKGLAAKRKATLADSIIISNSSFSDLAGGFALADEKENKGYYNVEKMVVTNCRFTGGKGVLLNVYRGGNDESTLGPKLKFNNPTLALHFYGNDLLI